MPRGGSSGRWVARQARDRFVRHRDQAGYRSRAAFKLEQIDQRDQVLRRGASVLDLGAAPGGWTQVALGRVGKAGRVVAVDRLKIEPLPGATLIHGDCAEPGVRDQIASALGAGGADLVMSDMAPNLTGIAVQDEAAHAELVALTLAMCRDYLRDGGATVIKLFQNAETDEIINEIRKLFPSVARRKPQASRSESREFYVVAKGYTV